jgi:hypothetical protein
MHNLPKKKKDSVQRQRSRAKKTTKQQNEK